MKTNQGLKAKLSRILTFVLGFSIVLSAGQPAVHAGPNPKSPGAADVQTGTAPEAIPVAEETYGGPAERPAPEQRPGPFLSAPSGSGENFALKKSVKASGNEVDYGLFPEMAVDGDKGTRWSSAKTDDSWFEVDLGGKKDIGQVVIHWQTPAKSYRVLTSVYGDVWENIKENDGLIQCEGGMEVLNFPSREARYVKFQGVERAPASDGILYGYSFYEFEVYQEDPIAKIIGGIQKLDPVVKGQTSLTLPPMPPGYKISVYGSDALPVIDKEGRIHPPLTDRTVQLLLQVESEADPARKAVTGNIGVHVPGLYTQTPDRNPEPKVIPSLREWAGGTGRFALTASSRIVISDPALLKTAEIVRTDLKEMTGLSPQVVQGKKASAGDLVMILDPALKHLGAGGYLLDVKDNVTITAQETKGIFWGTRSVLQILKGDPERRHLPAGTARDYPKYETRGLMIDVARKFYTIDFLRDYVKLLAWYKMTDLQIHLNDDVGVPFKNGQRAAFRLESERYPGLASSDGHYTKEEFRELQRLGSDYSINIIPEIDTPGHSRIFTTYDPSLGTDHTLDISKPATVDFVKSLFDEYIDGYNNGEPTFLGPDVHIGTDEYGGPSKEVFRGYMDTLIKHINSKGKHPHLWGGLNEYAGTTPISNEATMGIWYEPYGGPKQAMDLGYDIVNFDTNYMYLVPRLYRDYLNTPFLYRQWEPVKWPGVTLPYGLPRLKGGMFAIWNDISYETGVSMDDSHIRMLPAMQVLSEKMWQGAREGNDYDDFMATAAEIGEAPGVNRLHRVSTDRPDGLVIRYPFDGGTVDTSGSKLHGKGENIAFTEGKYGKAVYLRGGKSYVETPIDTMGFGWTVSMWIKPERDNPEDAVLMESPMGKIKLKQGKTGKLGFSKEDYDSVFNYEVPADKWTHLYLTGDAAGVSLYVNGNEYAEKLGLPVRRIQTLMLPVQKIGSETNAFKGAIDNMNIYNEFLPLLDVNNLALHQKAESSPLEAPEHTPGNSIDGNLFTRWSSAYDDASWMIVDLGKSQTINKVQIGWETAAEKFKLLVSEDKQTWTNVKGSDETLASAGKLDIIDFQPVKARYVKFQGVERKPVDGTKYGYSIYEFEVSGDDKMVPYQALISESAKLLSTGKGSPDLRRQVENLLLQYPVRFETVIDTLRDLNARLKESIQHSGPDPDPGDGGSGPGAGGGSSGAGGSQPDGETGKLTLKPGEGGRTGLGNEIGIEVPAGVSKETVTFGIRKIADPTGLTGGGRERVSPVFEVTRSTGSSLDKPIKLTLAYDVGKAAANRQAAVFTYDSARKQWTRLGGEAADGKISVDTADTGIFAVFAVKEEEAKTPPLFRDTAGHWAEEAVFRAVAEGIADGYPDGTFLPDARVTRAEFTVLLARALHLDGTASLPGFADAADIGAWAGTAAAQAVAAGIIDGYGDGTFRPGADITRTEMAVMTARALKLPAERETRTAFADNGDIPAWARGYVGAAAGLGLVAGREGGIFAPADPASRAEAVTLLLRAAGRK
ncbi:discoidin domain-containing protein [Paenibacillus sp. UNC499MF]|uniref:galactose-binding domain-containing protein n=1 Tax=Paenibacillus sp. UNC499MF TaxID=1502751 RepID=UPI00089FC50B|nr:discoidin domain-containing protein [Paenibacillus sp. UNC499MF]SEF70748.1 S-layer homology domain-containing protein [Paenibacillus sp. UNC499MF]